MKLFFQKIQILILGYLFAPIVTLAAPRSFKEFIDKSVLPLIDFGAKMLVSIAVLLFFWNVMSVLWSEDSADKKKKLASTITWGLLIIFIMVSIWGILYVFRLTLLRGL